MVCLSILLERRVTVSNNFTKRRESGFKIGTRDTFEIHLGWENFISNENSYLNNFFIMGEVGKLYLHSISVIFPYNQSLCTQAVEYTTYFELGEPVVWAGQERVETF